MSKSQSYSAQQNWQPALNKSNSSIIRKIENISYPVNKCLIFEQKELLTVHPLSQFIVGDNLLVPLDKINKILGSGLALIHYAAKAADAEFIKFLLDNGASINLKTQYSIESGLENITALSLVLETIKQAKTSQKQEKVAQLTKVKEMLLDYGASRLDMSKIRQETEEVKIVTPRLALKHKKSNEEIVRKCAKGDKQLEKTYLNFYYYLQDELAKDLSNEQTLSKKLTQEDIAKIIQDYAARISKFYREDIATPDKDLGHKSKWESKSKISFDFIKRVSQTKNPFNDSPTNIKKVASDDYQKKENEILPHWGQLVEDAINKFNEYLSGKNNDKRNTDYSQNWGIKVVENFLPKWHKENNIDYNKNLGVKVAESLLPKWHKGKMKISAKIKAQKEKLEHKVTTKDSLAKAIEVFTPIDKVFQLELACNLAQVAELSYRSKKKIESVTENWGFKLIAYRQSDLFKSMIMHDEESLIIAFRGTKHPANWISNIDARMKLIKVRDENIIVHKGFYQAMIRHWGKMEGQSKKGQQRSEDLGRELERPLKESVEKLLEQKPNLKIYVAGHSLGGAMAAIVYLQLLNLQIDGQPLSIDKMTLYTYGQPLWCSKGSVDKVAKFFDNNYYRVVNYLDLVPTVPPEIADFRHVGELYYLSKEGVILDQTSAEQILTDSEKNSRLLKTIHLANHGMFHYTRKLQNGEQPYVVKKLTKEAKSQILDQLSLKQNDEKNSKQDLNPLSREALSYLRNQLPKENQKKSELLESFRKQEATKIKEAAGVAQVEPKKAQLSKVNQTKSIKGSTWLNQYFSNGWWAYEKDEDGNSLLHIALKEGDIRAVKELLRSSERISENGEDGREFATFIFHEKNKEGKNVFHYAAELGDLETFEMLLSNEWLQKHSTILIRILDKYEKTVLHYAARGGNLEIVKLLLQKAPELINVNDIDGGTVLHEAAEGGNLEIVKLVLERKPELVSTTNNNNNTILHAAVSGGNPEIVNLLLERKSELIHVQNKKGSTVLHSAVVEGNLEIVKLLLEKQPELVNGKNMYNDTVLHEAAQGGNLEIVKLLIKKTPELIHIKNKNGQGSFNYALMFRHNLCAFELAIHDVEDISNLDNISAELNDSILIANSYFRYAIKTLAAEKLNLSCEAIIKSLEHNPYDLYVTLFAVVHKIDRNTIAADKNKPEAILFQQGVSLLEKQEYSQAISVFSNIDRSSLEEVQRAELALARGYCQVKLGQIKEAINSLQLYAQNADLSQVSATIYYYILGEIALQENSDNLSEALEYFAKSLEFDSIFLKGKVAIGKIYYKLCKYQEAKEILEGVLNNTTPSYLGNQLNICEQMLTNSKIRIYIEKEDAKIESFNILEDKIVNQIMYNIIVDAAKANEWLLQHLPSIIPAHRLKFSGLKDFSELNLDYGKNLLSPQGIIKNQYSVISSNLPVTKRPLSVKKAISDIKKHGLELEHPYFKLINDNIEILFQLKNLLGEFSIGVKDPNKSQNFALAETYKQAAYLINQLELYYKYYINQVIVQYGENYRKTLDDNKKYVIHLYEKAEAKNLLDTEEISVQVEDGRAGFLNKEALKTLSLKPETSDLKFGKHTVIKHDGIYYKYKPYAPGIEFAISSLYNNIAGGVTPPTKLIKLMHTKTGEQAIYLASISMGLVNFQEIIDDQASDYINKIDLDNYSNLFLLSLLTSPGDAKPDNFVVDFTRSSAGELESVRLISVDNDISFCKGKLGLQKLSGKAQIFSDVLNILYFLPQMDMIVSSKLVTELTTSKTKVIEVLSSWLENLHMQNSRYHYLSSNNFTKQDLKDLNLPIKLKSGTLVEIYHKLDQIVKWLGDNPYMTHSSLLKKFYPGISYFYENIRKENINNPFSAIKQAYAAAADSQELADQLQSRSALESKKAWGAISTSRMMKPEQFSQVFNNTIDQEAEKFIAAIDFSIFKAEDQAVLTIIRNNLFFVQNLNLHNISFEQLQELMKQKEGGELLQTEIKRFENLIQVNLIYSNSSMIPDDNISKLKITNLFKNIKVQYKIIQEQEIKLEADAARKIKLVSINDTSNINATQDESGNSKLHLAVINNQIKQVESLLNLGIDDSLRNKDGYTALDLSGQDQEKIAIYQLLADHQPELFWAAINSGSIKEATRLASTMAITKLQMPVQTDVVRMMSQPIYLAAEDERLTDLAYMLVSRGVKLSQKDQEGNNILHLISMNYQQDSAIGLISQIIGSYKNLGLSLDVRNKEGYLPADIAVMQKKYNLLIAYINEGYDLNIYDQIESNFSFNLKLCALVGKHGIKVDVEDIIQGLDLEKCNARGENILYTCSQVGDYNLFTKVIAMNNLPTTLKEQLQEENIWQAAEGSKDKYHRFANENTKELAMLYHKYWFKVSLEEVITGFSPKKVNNLGNNLIYEILKTLCFDEHAQIQKWQDFKLAIKSAKAGQIDINYTEKTNGCTPLHFAVTSMQNEAYIGKLVKHTHTELPCDKFGHTAYDLAQLQPQEYRLALELISFLATKQRAYSFDDNFEEAISESDIPQYHFLAGQHAFADSDYS